jgi:hypothetical protein
MKHTGYQLLRNLEQHGDHVASEAIAPDGRRVFLKQYAPLRRGGYGTWPGAMKHEGIRHPFLLECIDAAVQPVLTIPYAAFEWIDAEPIRVAPDARWIIEAVLSALSVAHARGLAHLDVRPGYLLSGTAPSSSVTSGTRRGTRRSRESRTTWAENEHAGRRSITSRQSSCAASPAIWPPTSGRSARSRCGSSARGSGPASSSPT